MCTTVAILHPTKQAGIVVFIGGLELVKRHRIGMLCFIPKRDI